MAKKENIVILLLQQVGILELLAVILGVPTMITVVLTIWHSLAVMQQAIVAVCTGLMIFAVGPFIYGRVRKVLFVIPRLLYKKHKLAESIAIKNTKPISEDTSIINLLSLAGVSKEF